MLQASPRNHRWPPRPVTAADGYRNSQRAVRVSRFFRLLGLSDPPTATTREGFMIPDAVRYMSVHSWTQWDSHGLSGTSPG
jgi:hypothetical protein